MLGDFPFGANIPVSSVGDARSFYEGVLGATPVRVQEREIIYQAGNTRFGTYQTESAGKAEHTLGTFSGVENIEATVSELRSRGVAFMEYDLPGLKTVDGIAQFEQEKVAWFKDPDGNILSIDDARLG